MRRVYLLLSCVLLTVPSLVAQSSDSSSSLAFEGAYPDGGGHAVMPVRGYNASASPFSHIAFGGGASTLGINMQAATNLYRSMNLRVNSNYFQHGIDNISTSGFTINATPSLASVDASVDIYPFPNHGFRLSPGVLLYNQNHANGTFAVQGGTSFSLNGYTYYASSTNPIMGTGSLNLHTQNPAFTATTGWGNMIPRRGGHWSFPVEVGVAFAGAPALNVKLNSGQACDGQGMNCVNVATDPGVQSNLAAQVAKYTNDLSPLRAFPIFSTGVAYSLRVR